MTTSSFSWLRAAARRQSSVLNHPLRPAITRPLFPVLSWLNPCFLPSEWTLLRSAIFFHETRGGARFCKQHHQHRLQVVELQFIAEPTSATAFNKPRATPRSSAHPPQTLWGPKRRQAILDVPLAASNMFFDASAVCSLRFWLVCGHVMLCSWRRLWPCLLLRSKPPISSDPNARPLMIVFLRLWPCPQPKRCRTSTSSVARPSMAEIPHDHCANTKVSICGHRLAFLLAPTTLDLVFSDAPDVPQRCARLTAVTIAVGR
ncbi:uncharacterized protein SCHCODRAFT_02084699 [Schizophyllum commune H4-8]|uniref:uncharacterized protein n=1 Tax=Schizophyllum commune (strain H4-8 / FGSC 9210) TaxID=578458 RepID=UPI002160962C|nr:uncharacterized protein SCHCODRAFT_02084699 [Schizophyllum commune H4-8]KAI5886904.1 hypothetical protein SCHCODRAFT_02084699 [Schizophyllum commune H4-8]